MGNRFIPKKIYLFKSLLKGLLVSIVLSIFFYLGISAAYAYLPGSILILIGLTIICFIIFWINLKYDEINDRIDVYAKTIAFDFWSSHPRFLNLLRFVRPLNPYIGAIGTIFLLASVLLAVPALIMYWAVYPGSPEEALQTGVFLMTAGIGLSYIFFIKDQDMLLAEKIIFFAGILIGTAGALKFLSWT
jgi:hypothetical protein